ncbi:MAG: electron transfer flavoprotein subunit beta [Chloroflexota bacterium]|jgi:electron transfer flavoprotein beta subunit
MNIVVPVKLVPDLVEELQIAASGTALDADAVRLILNELDEHAIEQAILLKERSGGQVTVVILDGDWADDVLYTAAAKGADRLIKLARDFEGDLNNHTLAHVFAAAVQGLKPDLVLTGVQAHDDLDGSLGPLLAELLRMPYVGYIAGVTVTNDQCVVRKEYPGALVAEMQVWLPAVLGVQAADEPPRYVAISKVRQAMKTATIEEQGVLTLLTATELEPSGGPAISRMFKPEIGERATMLEGDETAIAAQLVGIFQELGVL